MNPASSASPSAALSHPSALRRSAGHFAIMLGGSLFVAVCAHISIPLWFTPVPLSLEPFPVLLLGLLLGPATAASALMLYLAEGMAGLPVFSPVGVGGLFHVFGPTGGYLLAYPVAAFVTGALRRRMGRINFGGCLLAALAGGATVLLGGTLWFAAVSHSTPASLFALTVAPFIPGDILKAAAAAGVAAGFRRFRRA